jgi:hypothetical protein
MADAPRDRNAIIRNRLNPLRNIRSDVRDAWRALARAPGFTAVVVATLALGLGANGAVFALVDSVLLRPLPYPQPDRIAFVVQTLPSEGVFEVEATPLDYSEWHRARSFAALALVATDSYTLTGRGTDAERVRGVRATASLLPLLGLSPRIGRPFTPAEDDWDQAPTAILGDGLWRRRFGADASVVGRTIFVNGPAHSPGSRISGCRRGCRPPSGRTPSVTTTRCWPGWSAA